MGQLSFFQRAAISDKVRREWYLAMAKTIGDGKSVFKVVELLAGEYARARNPLAPLLGELIRRMSGGAGGHRSAESRVTVGGDLRGLVPANEAGLIDAGEASGDLAKGFKRAAEYLENTERLRAGVLEPLMEPAFLVVILLGILVFFSIQILPIYGTVSPRIRWPAQARYYAQLADHAIGIAVGVAAATALFAIAFVQLRARWVGPAREAFDKHVFPFNLMANIDAATVLTSLSGFVGAGIPFASALNQLQAGSTIYMARIYGALKASMASGRKPEEAICRIHIIARQHHWKIRLYGDSSDFPGAMDTINLELVEYALGKTRRMFAVVSMVLKSLVAAFVVWTVISMYGIVQSVRKSSEISLLPPTQVVKTGVA